MNEEYQLKSKHIFVTGASSGIGKATAIALSEAGAQLTITGRNEQRLDQCLGELKSGVRHEAIIADLCVEDDLTQLTDTLRPVDGWVHCAGLLQLIPLKMASPKIVKRNIASNYESAVNLAAALLKKDKIKRGASLVFISSIAASQPSMYGGALYGSTKSAIQGLCSGLAKELIPMKVRVNCLLPGTVLTEGAANWGKLLSEERKSYIKSLYQLGMIEPADVANAALFLLSAQSSKITGVSLPIHSGALLFDV